MKTNHPKRRIKSFISKRDAAVVIAMLAVGLASSHADPLTGGAYDDEQAVAVETVLPAGYLNGGNYEIDELADAGNLFYRFSVRSDFGTLQVSSVSMLRRRLGELVKLEELRRAMPDADSGNEFIRYGEDDVFSDALGTAWRIQRRSSANETAVNTDISGASFTESVADDHPTIQWRTAAARVGLDPYSSFPPVQVMLTELSRRLGGSSFPKSINAIPSNSVFARRLPIDETFEFEMANTIKNSNRGELRSEITRRLSELDVPIEVTVGFLNNKAYIESDRYRLVRLLEQATRLDGKAALLAAAASAETEVDGLAFLNFVRLVSAYNSRVEPVVSVIGVTRYPALLTSGGAGLLALPIDYLPWTERTAQLAAGLAAIRDQRGLKTFTVLLLGKPTDRARAEMDRLNVKVIDEISRSRP